MLLQEDRIPMLKTFYFVAGAVKKHFKLTVEKDLENDIKVWLKHAPQRAKARLTRNNSQSLASSQRQYL